MTNIPYIPKIENIICSTKLTQDCKLRTHTGNLARGAYEKKEQPFIGHLELMSGRGATIHESIFPIVGFISPNEMTGLMLVAIESKTRQNAIAFYTTPNSDKTIYSGYWGNIKPENPAHEFRKNSHDTSQSQGIYIQPYTNEPEQRLKINPVEFLSELKQHDIKSFLKKEYLETMCIQSKKLGQCFELQFEETN